MTTTQLNPGTIKAHRVCFTPGRLERICLLKAARRTKQQFTSLVCKAVEDHLGQLLTEREKDTLPPFVIKYAPPRTLLLEGANLTIRIGERAAICLARETLRSGYSLTEILCKCIQHELQRYLPNRISKKEKVWFEPKRKGFLAFVIDQAGSNLPPSR